MQILKKAATLVLLTVVFVSLEVDPKMIVQRFRPLSTARASEPLHLQLIQ